MKIYTNSNYKIKSDLEMFLNTEKINIEQLSRRSNISKSTIYEIINTGITTKDVYEKFYSYAYSLGYRINKTKEEFYKSNYNLVLYHASKKGIDLIDCDKSRKNCDFGSGFYLGQSYDNSLDFICDYYDSVVYSFSLDISNLNVLKLEPSLDWMLIICYYRGQLEKYKDNKHLVELIKRVNEADIIIAPIADNRMYYIMSLFTNGDINENVCIKALIGANLGMQYVLKTKKSLEKIDFIEKHYLCNYEKNDALNRVNKRAIDVDELLKDAKREYRDGRYIEEVLK